MVKTKNPDLIITDYNMPVMNGPEFCRQLRRDILLRHLPVIMLTGKSETKDMVTGIESGADDYLVKPFEPETLLARIRMILKRTIRSLDANPLTHLPGNSSIMEEFQYISTAGKPLPWVTRTWINSRSIMINTVSNTGTRSSVPWRASSSTPPSNSAGKMPLWGISAGMISCLSATMTRLMPSARTSLMPLIRFPRASITMRTGRRIYHGC